MAPSASWHTPLPWPLLQQRRLTFRSPMLVMEHVGQYINTYRLVNTSREVSKAPLRCHYAEAQNLQFSVSLPKDERNDTRTLNKQLWITSNDDCNNSMKHIITLFSGGSCHIISQIFVSELDSESSSNTSLMGVGSGCNGQAVINNHS